MDLKTKLVFEIQLFKDHYNELLDSIKTYCQNTDYPLSDRWDIFLLSGMGDHYPYIQRFHPLVSAYTDEVAELVLADFKEVVLQNFIQSFIFN